MARKNKLSTDWFCMDDSLGTPISETHDFLLEGRANLVSGTRRRKLATFQSMDAKQFGSKKNQELGIANMENLKREMSTQYNLDYHPRPGKCSQRPKEVVKPVYNLLNRIGKYEFIMSPSAPTKFMDDYLIEPSSPARQNINLLRQISDYHFLAVM
uniref:Uncharacterized protein n=1 Tax=Glossina palpalis gambiensis TaxID=67801 RepID=A0A1B0BMB7_9MUSC